MFSFRLSFSESLNSGGCFASKVERIPCFEESGSQVQCVMMRVPKAETETGSPGALVLQICVQNPGRWAQSRGASHKSGLSALSSQLQGTPVSRAGECGAELLHVKWDDHVCQPSGTALAYSVLSWSNFKASLFTLQWAPFGMINCKVTLNIFQRPGRTVQ